MWITLWTPLCVVATAVSEDYQAMPYPLAAPAPGPGLVAAVPMVPTSVRWEAGR